VTHAGLELSDDSTDEAGDDIERWTLELTSADAARWVFRAYLVLAVPVLMIMGSKRWFLGDEWTFLSSKSATSLHDLFQPHNQHWSTIPLIYYRTLYTIFGLHHYWPYQLPVVLAHLTIAALLRHIMRRTGVGPWMATIAAGTYVLFGPGSDDILWAFQIGFTLSVVFGLGQMILADHEGPLDRRDWMGLGLGLLALLCSGQAPPVILATGIAVLWRRGWRQAAFHTVPLGIIYSIWYLTQHAALGTIRTAAGQPVPGIDAGEFIHFMWAAALGLFAGLGHFPLVDWILAVALVVGVVLAWVDAPDGKARAHRMGMPVGLMVGAAVGMAAAAPSRWFFGADAGRANRYVGVSVAMALPLFALAADALARRWRVLTPALFAVFLLPVPWSINQLPPKGLLGATYYKNLQNWVASVTHLPEFKQVPGWVEPNGHSLVGQPDLTVGWLRSAARQGKLPARQVMNPLTRTVAVVQLGLALRGGTSPPHLTCRTSTRPLPEDPKLGEVWHMGSDLQVTLRGPTGKPAGLAQIYLRGANEALLQATLPNQHLLVMPVFGAKSFRLCT
jgi:hypothetical protein